MKTTGIHHLVEALQREAGRGCVKAVNVTVFFDEHGRIIGRTGFKTVQLYPRELGEHVQGNEEALAAVLIGSA